MEHPSCSMVRKVPYYGSTQDMLIRSHIDYRRFLSAQHHFRSVGCVIATLFSFAHFEITMFSRDAMLRIERSSGIQVSQDVCHHSTSQASLSEYQWSALTTCHLSLVLCPYPCHHLFQHLRPFPSPLPFPVRQTHHSSYHGSLHHPAVL